MLWSGEHNPSKEGQMGTAIDFPFFDVENHDSTMNLAYAFHTEPLRQLLREGGFKVRRMYTSSNRLMRMGAMRPETRGMTHFDVMLPEGWQIVDGYNGYGQADKDVKHLLDDKGRFRGHIGLDLDGTPVSATLFCRYRLLIGGSEWGWYRLPIKPTPLASDCQWAVIVDRADVDRSNPNVFPKIVYHALRFATPPKRKPLADALEEITEVDIAEHMREELNRVHAGKAPNWHPIHQWLNGHYPEWQSPWVYWND